jgi:hypothetical protein
MRSCVGYLEGLLHITRNGVSAPNFSRGHLNVLPFLMVLSCVCIVGGRRSSASSGGRRSSVAVAAATRARAELLAEAWYSTQNFEEESWEYLWYFDTQVHSTYRKRWLLEVSEDPDTIAGWVHPVTGWVHPGPLQ